MFCGQRENASYRIIAECQEMIDSKFLHDLVDLLIKCYYKIKNFDSIESKQNIVFN